MNAVSRELPIYDCADALVAGIRERGRVVLSAPTGSGKSTQVPQILKDEAGVAGEIVVAEPRRMAARLLARRVAAERGGRPGGEVGYQVRFENVRSERTRIRFVTEAILLRQILADPALPGIGGVVFDEFHERHIDGDLGLACALRALRSVRPDLKIVVMSATLETGKLAEYLDPCARVESGGRLYPVETRFFGAALRRGAGPVWERAAAAFRALCREWDAGGSPGDGLVFMPGAYEIAQTLRTLSALPETRGYEVLPLHGNLPAAEQERAVAKGERPRIVVATNVAETSLTIEGVEWVIDGGLAKKARYDSRRGINSLLTEPISRASAEQRTGRAGRTGPGRCLRLWSEAEHAARPEREAPEIKKVDLAETVLLLAGAGYTRLGEFPWYEPPEPEALEKARTVLRDLGALDADGGATERGRRMARFPLHPRYARMLLEGERLGVLPSMAGIAALSQGRGLYRPAADGRVRNEQIRRVEEAVPPGSDFFVHLRALELAREAGFKVAPCRDLGIHAGSAKETWEQRRQILGIAEEQGLRIPKEEPADAADCILRCLLAGLVDHLALRLDNGTRRCRMIHGRTGELRRESVVTGRLLVAAEMEERPVRGEVVVLLGMAAAVEREWLAELFPGDFATGTRTIYDADARRVVCLREQRFRDLVLESAASGNPPPGAAAELLAEEVLAGRLKLKKWDAEVDQWIRRVNFVARHCPDAEIAPLGTEELRFLVEQVCQGAASYKEIRDRPVLPVFREWLGNEQTYCVETLAPAELTLPRRKRPVKLRYETDGRVVLASKLQDFYDVPGKNLRLAGGKVAPVVELLAPNGRPAHVTDADDLDAFWEGVYPRVRKELAGRYPKHEWR